MLCNAELFIRDEELLCQGLALNDDLQCVLPKHESIASGSAGLEKSRTSVTVQKPKNLQSLVDIDDVVGTKDDTTHHDGRVSSGASTSQHVPLLVPVPPSNGSVTPPSVKVDPKMDLLSGEDFDNSLALVPVDAPQPTTSVSSQQNNVLDLTNMFSQSNINLVSHPTYGAGQTYPPISQFQPQQQQTFYTNGSAPPSYESPFVQQTNPSWNGQVAQGLNKQQPQSPYSQMMGGMVPPQTMYVGGKMMGGMIPQTMHGGGQMMGGMVPPQMMHGYGGENFSSVNNPHLMQQRGQHMTQLYEQQKGDDVWWKE
ncbi:hypothetical protein MKX03_031812 [Papaver bracteatum]|nr:hypothetical protein MKX03_031812 [Papaver bracteatum]